MKQTNQRDAIYYIATRQEFKASALSGTNINEGAGKLDNEETARYNEAVSKGADYFVYSYRTPIAWHTLDGWYMVEQKFSQTTSTHQNYVRRGVAESLEGTQQLPSSEKNKELKASMNKLEKNRERLAELYKELEASLAYYSKPENREELERARKQYAQKQSAQEASK